MLRRPRWGVLRTVATVRRGRARWTPTLPATGPTLRNAAPVFGLRRPLPLRGAPSGRGRGRERGGAQPVVLRSGDQDGSGVAAVGLTRELTARARGRSLDVS
eukprot:3857289-Alexandrium_andersonii.AAC.1